LNQRAFNGFSEKLFTSIPRKKPTYHRVQKDFKVCPIYNTTSCVFDYSLLGYLHSADVGRHPDGVKIHGLNQYQQLTTWKLHLNFTRIHVYLPWLLYSSYLFIYDLNNSRYQDTKHDYRAFLPSVFKFIAKSWNTSYAFYMLGEKSDRLCGLVVRVLDYRSGGPGSIPGTTTRKKQ
jgi:hypothetical protein